MSKTVWKKIFSTFFPDFEKMEKLFISSFQLRLGDRDLNNAIDDKNVIVRGISKTHQHPDWRGESSYNDVAIWEMDREVKYNNTIRPICLPEQSDVNIEKHNNVFVTLLGKLLDEKYYLSGSSDDIFHF